MFGSKKYKIDVISIIFNPHRSYIVFVNYFYKKKITKMDLQFCMDNNETIFI